MHLLLAAAVQHIQNGNHAAAIESLSRIIEQHPDHAEVYANLGSLLNGQGYPDKAETLCRKALELKPDLPEALCALADALHDQGRLEEAIATYRQAICCNPLYFHAFNNLSVSLNAAGRHEEALQACTQALHLAPEMAEAFANLGVALKGLGRAEEAEAAYRHAISLKPDIAASWSSLGSLLAGQGRYDEALTAYRRALALKPDLQECRLKHALLLPPLKPETVPELADKTFMQALAELEQGTGAEDWAALGACIGVVQPFALAYRTGDHTAALKRYGSIACRARAAWFARHFQGVQLQGRPLGKRIRLVIVSGQISNHSVWNVLLHGLLKHIDRNRFETILYNTTPSVTDEATTAMALVDQHYHGLTNWVQQALHDQPDCIFYPEIAMDVTTAQLATLRLAPLQIAGWGHPITSGLPTIDLYCSGELLERPDADSDYSERLIRLPGVGACSVLPEVRAVLPDPKDLDIPVDRSITRFLVCQQAAKFDPSFDSLYPRIALNSSPCRFWFVRDSKASWMSARLYERFHDAFAACGLKAAEYIRIIDWLPGEQFLGLLDNMDVYLDTPAFSGYTTAWQALHRGLPVVTLEGRFMRQRLAAGLLRRLGLTATIATDDDDYVLLAAALASDPHLRTMLRECLKKAARYTDENSEVVRAFESLIQNNIFRFGDTRAGLGLR